MNEARTPPRKKAREIAKYLRGERPDYTYLKSVFRALRDELDIEVPGPSRKLPDTPSEDEVRRYYEAVWHARNVGDMVLIKTLLYTGVRVSELIRISLDDVDFARCQIRINKGKGAKDRIVPFPVSFKETLALHADSMRKRGANYPFESSWKKPYSDRGVRKILIPFRREGGLHPAE